MACPAFPAQSVGKEKIYWKIWKNSSLWATSTPEHPMTLIPDYYLVIEKFRKTSIFKKLVKYGNCNWAFSINSPKIIRSSGCPPIPTLCLYNSYFPTSRKKTQNFPRDISIFRNPLNNSSQPKTANTQLFLDPFSWKNRH